MKCLPASWLQIRSDTLYDLHAEVLCHPAAKGGRKCPCNAAMATIAWVVHVAISTERPMVASMARVWFVMGLDGRLQLYGYNGILRMWEIGTLKDDGTIRDSLIY
jgi:hypothetical protein